MAELLASERLQPCLLDRLTDDDPHSQKEGREQRVMSMRTYRSAVLRDLSWLLNTGNIENVDDISEYPDVKQSVLNFGMPDLCGKSASGLEPAELEAQIAQTIRAFEPRILPHTLVIRSFSKPEEYGTNVFAFELEGELWAQPMHEALFIKTELDLETGSVTVKESGQ